MLGGMLPSSFFISGVVAGTQEKNKQPVLPWAGLNH